LGIFKNLPQHASIHPAFRLTLASFTENYLLGPFAAHHLCAPSQATSPKSMSSHLPGRLPRGRFQITPLWFWMSLCDSQSSTVIRQERMSISSSPARRLGRQQGVIDFPNTARVFIN
jgi:hypothetical protein